MKSMDGRRRKGFCKTAPYKSSSPPMMTPPRITFPPASAQRRSESEAGASRKTGRLASTSTSYIARPLLPPEEVRRLNPKKAIIFKETSRPILAEKVRYYEDRRLTKLLLDPPTVPPLPARGRSASEAERVTLEDATEQGEELHGILDEFKEPPPAKEERPKQEQPQPA